MLEADPSDMLEWSRSLARGPRLFGAPEWRYYDAEPQREQDARNHHEWDHYLE